MQMVLHRLAELGPSGAILLIMTGLVYGLAGWRILRYLVLADAIVVALLLGSSLRENQPYSIHATTLAGLAAVLLAIGLPYLAWRFPRWAAIAMGGLAGFLISQVLVIHMVLPLSVHLLLGAIGAGLVMAMHATLFRQTAVFVTGLHGGWLCLAALTALLSRPNVFGSPLIGMFRENLLLFPLVAFILSAILVALQWADMERCTDPF